MHDQRDPTSSPREPATPPPLPPRFEPRIQLHIEPAPKTSRPGGAPVRKASHKRLALCYGLGGFAAGVVFWHAVGFWQFMHSTIYSGTGVAVSESRSQPTLTSGSFADAIDRAISSSSQTGKPASITTGAVTPAAGKSPARFDGAQAGAASENPTNCASFTRDPATGEVRSRPCSDQDRALPHDPNGTREAFAQQTATSPESRWPSYMPAGAAD